MSEALSQAVEQERQYEWLGAVDSYMKAMIVVSEQDLPRKGELYERMGYALYRAAMQAGSGDEFQERMDHGIACYEKAGESYGRASDPAKMGRKLRCESMIAYLNFWLASDPADKKRRVDESMTLTEKTLKSFEGSGDAEEYRKTYDQLSATSMFGFALEWNYQAREKIAREAVEYAEQALAFFSDVGDPKELAKAYAKMATNLHGFGFYLPDLERREGYSRKALDYWMKAKELSEAAALIELPNFLQAAPESLGGGTGTESALTIFWKALAYAKKTKDRFIVGSALDWLAYHTFWKSLGTEDPNERLELPKKALQYAQEAKEQYSSIHFLSPRDDVLWVEAPHAEYYWGLASFETDVGRRRELLQRALEVAPDLMKRAQDSGYPDIVSYAHHVFGKTFASLAKIESQLERKKGLLEEALKHRIESIRILEQAEFAGYFNRGVMQNYLAEIKSELSGLALDLETKGTRLSEAVRDKGNALKLCIKQMPFFERIGALHLFGGVGKWQYEYGDLLNRQYELTGNGVNLREAAEAFRGAAESFEKLNLASRMAECYWKAAQTYDLLEEHLKAAENFTIASNNYRVAADKIPELKTFYEDHAFYMEAWSEIETARHHHARQEYGLAKEYYDKVAILHKSLKGWSYLASNYSAWAQVENAEDLSRKERSEEALQAFREAAGLFKEAKGSLQTELSKIENEDEKHMVAKLVKAADLRQEYCKARINLEEAKILDRKGDHYSSSEKYGQAIETFEKITQALESEQTRREFRLIITLSKAWQIMAQAEAEASPQLYLEASRLFEEAKALSPNETAKMLALGNSRFCKALEAGTRFADTRDATLHASAVQHLESAASYYVRAGFQNASEYADASKLLFDAYVYTDEANKERDHEKKAKLFMMAEKVLQASAGSFTKAEHLGKKEEVLRLLEKVKKERELALSLTEVLHAPSILSTTAAFSTPTPTHERAVGLERFEHADIQGSVITRQKSLKVGEDLDFEIELVNAGKGPAQLVKVEEVIPEGFELTGRPEPYRVEDSYLNMKGKRLDPLKTEEVKLVLKPKVQGLFTLKPRILYLDESGKYKSHEPEPIDITVKELGISGWLKGR